METEKLEKIKSIEQIGKGISTTVEQMSDKVMKAKAALSSIKEIASDEDDEHANNLLKKVRATYTVVAEMRKSITEPMDEIKSYLMDYEKQIDTKKGSDSDYQRVKLLRDQYATLKAEKERLRLQEIERKKHIDIEIARLKSEMVVSVESKALEAVHNGEVALNKMLQSLTLDNYDHTLKKLSYKPKLNIEAFRKWIQIDYDKSLITDDEYLKICEDAENHFDFAKVNQAYIDSATELLKEYQTVKFPEKLSSLQEIASMDAEKAQRVMKLQQEQEAKEKEDRDREFEKNRLQAIQEARDKGSEETLDAEFNAQIEAQASEAQSGIRKTYEYRLHKDFEKKPAFAIEAITSLMIKCLSHPDSKGIFKRDAQGFVKNDDKNNPIYADGFSYWLKEAAKLKVGGDVSGIDVIENISTIAK